MGKESRRDSRRNRPKPIRYVAEGARLKVVVVTQPHSGRGVPVNVDRDVALVKSALLYADHVDLISPGAAMVTSAGALSGATTRDALELLGSLDEETWRHLGGADVPDNWRQAVQGMLVLSQLPPDVVRQTIGDGADELLEGIRTHVERFENSTAQLRQTASALVDGSGLRELEDPIQMGLVTVNPMGVDAGDSDAVLASYVEQLKSTLSDPSVHALFDDSSAALARSLVRERHVEPHRLTLVHARQAAVGGGLLARLPSFPGSAMSDVLALRSDLSSPLGRYRRAVVSLADKLHTQAYDSESADEIDDLWRSEVAPTLDELRDGFQEHAFIRQLGREISASPAAISAGIASAGAVIMGMQSAAGIDAALASVGGAAPTAAALVHHGIKAAVARHDARADLQRNDLFYLHEVNRRLQER